jgi:hypothetical protein
MSIPITARQKQPPIKNYDHVFTFGKHKGKTVNEVAEEEPSYIVWLVEENVCEVDEEIYEAAIMDDMNNSPPEDYFWDND